MQCYSLGSRKVCCTLVFNFALFGNFLFCVLCFTNIGFVQCYSLGSHKVCCTRVLYFALFSNFCFACFASQTSGLCSAFHSAPVKSVTRFCYALVSTLFCVFCLTNIGLMQCFSLRLPSCLHPLVFFNVLFSLLLLCVLCRTSSGLCNDFSPAPFEFARFIFCFVLFSFNFVFCVLSLPNLIFLRFP